MKRPMIPMLALTILIATPLRAAEDVERNVVYGMYSGLALVMDVYRPVKPNGAGIVAIQGSGWYQPMRFDAPMLSARAGVQAYARSLSQAGYTVFVINHRSTPRFHFPAPLEDAQRAVRFMRAHAAEYRIDPARIGAYGSSSGGHLAELLGTLDAPGISDSVDPVDRESAKVKAVVALFAPSDLRTLRSPNGRMAHVVLMGFEFVDPANRTPGSVRENESETVEYRRASPIAQVTPDDAATLLMHGDADEVIPIAQSEDFAAALKGANVPVRFIRVPGGRHGDDFRLAKDDPRLPDQFGEARRWFDQYLK